MNINQQVHITINRGSQKKDSFIGIVTEIHGDWIQVVNLPKHDQFNERFSLTAPIVSIKSI